MNPSGDCQGVASPVNRAHRVPPCRLCTRLGLLGPTTPAAVRRAGVWVCDGQRIDDSCGAHAPLPAPGAANAPGVFLPRNKNT